MCSRKKKQRLRNYLPFGWCMDYRLNRSGLEFVNAMRTENSFVQSKTHKMCQTKKEEKKEKIICNGNLDFKLRVTYPMIATATNTLAC